MHMYFLIKILKSDFFSVSKRQEKVTWGKCQEHSRLFSASSNFFCCNAKFITLNIFYVLTQDLPRCAEM